jgi:hypothetical protein
MADTLGSLRFSGASDVDELKRAWYNHVLSTLEKLDSRVDNLSAELYSLKTAMQRDLYTYKEELQKEINSSKTLNANDLEKIQEKTERLIDKLSQRIEILEKSVLKEELLKELNTIKSSLTKDITDQKEEFLMDINEQKDEFNKLLEPIKAKITRIEIRLAVWAAVFGIIGTLIMNIVLFVIKEYFIER